MGEALLDRVLPPSPGFAWPSLAVDRGKLAAYMEACRCLGVVYGLGAKADGAGRGLLDFPPAYRSIDCSGWVRAAVAYSSGVVLPDGSCNQHDWAREQGLKPSNYNALGNADGVLRIAFLPVAARRPVGHVLLCSDGRTWESCGGRGPCRRAALGLSFLASLDVFVLALAPSSAPEVANG